MPALQLPGSFRTSGKFFRRAPTRRTVNAFLCAAYAERHQKTCYIGGNLPCQKLVTSPCANLNGNIRGFIRKGKDGGIIDSLTFNYGMARKA